MNDTVSLSTDYINLYRNKANLIASYANSTVSVDKYGKLTLDASSSYDPDNLGLSYTYKWTCPNQVGCSSFTSSSLVLSTNQRSNGNANVNGTTYQYLVAMTDGTRTSNTVTATVTITMLSSYAFCLQSSLVSDSIVGYNSSLNTVFLEYKQQQTT